MNWYFISSSSVSSLHMSAAQTVKHASAILETAPVSVSIWEAMAVMQAAAWRLEISLMVPLSASSPDLQHRRWQHQAPTSHTSPKPGSVDGRGGSTAAARKPLFVFACMFVCMFACMSPSVLSPGLCNKLYSVNRELLLIELKSNFLNWNRGGKGWSRLTIHRGLSLSHTHTRARTYTHSRHLDTFILSNSFSHYCFHHITIPFSHPATAVESQ